MPEVKELPFRPQPGPQARLMDCPIPTVLYGGARGGGKTFGMILKNAIKASMYGRDQKGIFFRRELPQLEHAIETTRMIYSRLGWKWQEQKKTFTSPEGATLKFRSLERDSDAEKYQGQEYTDIYFEEVTNYPSPKPIDRMYACLRSAAGVPVQMHFTCNPGGPGHSWVKSRWIDPAPQGWKILKDKVGSEFIFIPAKVDDNKELLESDPGYIARLKMVGSETLVRAWLDGDWNVVEGAYFDCWNPKMVLEPFPVPRDWIKFRSFDWGSARPFSAGWWAVVSDAYQADSDGGKVLLPRGALVRYREWYGCTGEPNIGLKLTAEQVRDGIIMREDEEVRFGVADPAIFAQDGGPSIAERMFPLVWNRADNKRVARGGHMGGWDQMRQRMMGDEAPMIYCFKTCTDSIRTIPSLQHDPNRAEDLDTSAEDHAADEWRYACMSRPWARPRAEKEKPRDRWDRWDKEEVNWKTV